VKGREKKGFATLQLRCAVLASLLDRLSFLREEKRSFEDFKLPLISNDKRELNTELLSLKTLLQCFV